MDDIHLKINDMLIYIINYVHQDLVLLGVFITDPERYLCCYYHDDEDYATDYDADDDDEDYEEKEYDDVENASPLERARRLLVRNLMIDQHFMYSISMFGTLNKVE